MVYYNFFAFTFRDLLLILFAIGIDRYLTADANLQVLNLNRVLVLVKRSCIGRYSLSLESETVKLDIFQVHVFVFGYKNFQSAGRAVVQI